MDLILEEFLKDLSVIKIQLGLLDQVKKFSSVAYSPETQEQEVTGEILGNKGENETYFDQAKKVHEHARDAHSGLPVIIGTTILYIAGRFEEYTRTAFEDLCQKIAGNAGKFNSLPKKMQDNLVAYTATVIQSPRKYNHGDGAVKTFSKNLASNLNNDSIDINYQCLSITDANMRPDMLADLYDRIGVKEIWKKIGQQAQIQAHFGSQDAGAAETLAKKKLNNLMDLRNSIAHPSTALTWPDSSLVLEYVEVVSVLARALSILAPVFAIVPTNAALSAGTSENRS